MLAETLRRAQQLHEFGRFEAALEEFGRVLAQEPDNTAAWVGRGAALSSLDRREEALDAFRRALVLDPDNTAVHGRVAYLLLQLERVDEALHAANAVLERQPDNAFGHAAAALAMAASSQRGGPYAYLMQVNARTAIAKAQELGPQSPEIWYCCGIACGLLGDAAGRTAALETALSLDPQHEMALFQLAAGHAEKRRLRRALRLTEALLAINPQTRRAPHLIVGACGEVARRIPLPSLAVAAVAVAVHALEIALDTWLAVLRVVPGIVLAAVVAWPVVQLVSVPAASSRFLRGLRGFTAWWASMLLLPAAALVLAWGPWPVAAVALVVFAAAVLTVRRAGRLLTTDLYTRFGTPDRPGIRTTA